MNTPLKGTLGKIDNVIFAITKYLSYIGGVALVAIMLIAFFNVLGEKILVKGIPNSADIIKYLHMPVVFTGMAYVNLDTGHTRIDLLSSKFPAFVQKICMTIGNIFGAFICGFIAYRGVERVVTYFERNMLSATGSGFILWPFAAVLVVGFALLAVTYVWAIVRQYAPHEEVPTESEEGGEQ